MGRWRLRRSSIARILLGLILAGFYVHAAREHAARVNTFQARADQSGYMYDATVLYADWHGQTPGRLVDRNRMPLYGGFLALFYEPRMSNDEFFTRAKEWNIWLSLALLGLMYPILRLHLPPLTADNLLLVIAFGYFVFRAGYVQSELLFYFLLFATFVVFCRLLARPATSYTVAYAVAGGVLAGLAHLTKASILPLLGIFVIVYGGSTFWRRNKRDLGWHVVTLAALLVAFIITVFPYISNSERAFGQYFYNVNTTFYAWYDNWPEASVGTMAHGDHVRWPDMPRRDLPGVRKYLREHSARQIADRVGNGFWKMAEQSYTMFWIMKYVTMYVAFCLALIVTCTRGFAEVVRRRRALFTFLAIYALVYSLSMAFYAAISGPERFLLAHVAPLLFAVAWLATRSAVGGTPWRLADVPVSEFHFELLVSATVALDLIFTLWPRLMTTYGGF